MLKKRKSAALEHPVPNFTGYDYSDVIGDFSEHDRLSEKDISQLICADEFQLERPLNSFNDHELNDHLYHLFYCKKTENISLMRRWISYYVRQYPKQITAIVQPYLNLKKLTLEDWLRCVKDGRRGDIMCVLLLSLSTGVHTVVHLNNNKLWSTLKTIPATHSELLRICDQHLAYLGFGIFLKLERKPIQKTILGTVTGIDNATQQLLLQSINAASVDETATCPQDSVVGTDKTSYTSTYTGAVPSLKLENTTPLTGTTLSKASSYTVTSTIPKADDASGGKEQMPLLQVELSGITPSNTRLIQPTSLSGTTLPEALPYTGTSHIRRKPKASAAAGSEEQLPRLQAELSGMTPHSRRHNQSSSYHTSTTLARNKRRTKDIINTESETQLSPVKTNLPSTVSRDSSSSSSKATTTRICKKQSKVHLMPFQVQLTRLSDKELEKYLHSCDTEPASTPSSSARLSPIATRSVTRSKKPQQKKRLISGHPSKINVPTFDFQIRRHILHRHRRRMYFKCRVRGCTLAYTSFKRLKDLNTHHRIYHPLIYYNCRHCRKRIYTPSTWQFHQYCQRPKLKKCTVCNKFFLFENTLKQHRRCHSKVKMFRCIFGRCQQSYKHPQDLSRHVAMHQEVTYNCEMCDKTFTQRRLLKRHEVIHTNLLPHVCRHCSQAFHHSTQLYRHKHKFHAN